MHFNKYTDNQGIFFSQAKADSADNMYPVLQRGNNTLVHFFNITKNIRFLSIFFFFTSFCLCIIGTGKKAFIQADGIKTLYTLSLETLDCKLTISWV